jgi:hypothetical protein
VSPPTLAVSPVAVRIAGKHLLGGQRSNAARSYHRGRAVVTGPVESVDTPRCWRSRGAAISDRTCGQPTPGLPVARGGWAGSVAEVIHGVNEATTHELAHTRLAAAAQK